MNILIVDDDSTSRMILKAMLQELGHEVTARENGAQAFDHFCQTPVPFVISDMIMSYAAEFATPSAPSTRILFC